MKNFFSIGETAKINRISIQALRHYDKIGLLKPSFINEDSGYRYYSVDQFIIIDIIKLALNFGVPLKDLKETLLTENILEFSEKIKKYNELMEEKIHLLLKAKRRFSKASQVVEYSLNAVQKQKPYQRMIEERLIVKLKNQEDVQNFEVNSRLVELSSQETHMEFDFESGYIIDGATFLGDMEENFTSAYMVVTNGELSKQSFLSQDYVIDHFPKGEYVCITYNKHNKQERFQLMKLYLIDNNIRNINTIIVTELFDDFADQSNELQIYLHS
ncbi:MerR family DNA-binding transcriptional regulator [Paenibacillus sp. NPDC056933]|uniref:MerR family DNA-binding transcriptional regulator n=1 Tax=Paenibacillus sp. NPDC056933 TaxID=3345968 RepID=UPI0036283BDD